MGVIAYGCVRLQIGIHPDDPPFYSLGGVPRCIFGTFEGYKRAMAIADSPNIGVCLCLGCWLEGGKDLMGADALTAIRSQCSRAQSAVACGVIDGSILTDRSRFSFCFSRSSVRRHGEALQSQSFPPFFCDFQSKNAFFRAF